MDHKERMKKFLAKNPDYYKKYYRKNREKMLLQSKTYIKARENLDPSYKLGRYLRKRMNAVLKNKVRTNSAVRDLGCSLSQLQIHLQDKFMPEMTWNNHGQGPGTWQIDHIRPLVSFDLTDSTQFKAACHYTNLQPLWNEDHIAKTAEDVATWR